MPRARTGTIKLHGDHYKARITLNDGSRPWVDLPAGLTEPEARARAKSMSTKTRERRGVLDKDAAAPAAPAANGAAPTVPGETCAAWTERWLAARKVRGLSSIDTDRGRLNKWILPTIRGKTVAAVTRDDIEAIVEHLDASVTREDLSWKTALNVWGLVSKMFKDACSSKVRALRARTDNPAAGVPGPDRGARKAKAYLYPSEVLALVACEGISLAWRRALALSVYLYVRPGELRALRWEEDVNIDHATAHVHRSIDREGDAKTTKTGITRRIPLESPILPLLRAMQAEAAGQGPVIELPDDRHLSRSLRGMLDKAGVTRPELRANDATRKGLTWYDLRATGITWMAIRGDDPLKIMSRAGHVEFSTTQGYIREAEAVRAGFGDVFPPLPAALLGEANDPQGDPPADDSIVRESSESEENASKQGGGAGNRTRVREASRSPSFTCVAAVGTPAAGLADSAAT
jgi:integrase